jgi:putative tryptophan/tyrosine transport system substrate-binding protein
MRRREFIVFIGGAVWPLVTRAQRSTNPVIGYLSGGAPGFSAPYVSAFRQGLNDTGYVEGRNVRTEYRWAEGRYDRLPALAAELVRLQVDVIAASGGDVAARAAKGATSTVPIAFTGAGDPVADGLVASLARPGGNVTGISFLAVELSPKRIDLISELVPNARIIALLVNPTNANTRRVIQDVLAAARARGLELLTLMASSSGEIDAAFDALVKQRAQSLIVDPDHFIDSRREQLVALAARHSIPAIYGLRELTAAGGLMSYGVRLTDAYRQLGIYTGTILKGTRPSELPVQQPTRFELVINLKTAKALGIAVPATLLARADEVIE